MSEPDDAREPKGQQPRIEGEELEREVWIEWTRGAWYRVREVTWMEYRLPSGTMHYRIFFSVSKTSPAADDTSTLEIESSDAELREVQAAIKRADAGSIILIRMREGRIVLETGNRSIMSRPGAMLICFAEYTYGVTRVECISFGEERCLLALTLTERLIRRQLIDSPEAVEHNTFLIEGPRAIRDAIKLHAEKGSADELLFVYVDDNGEYIVGWETKTRLELEASLDRDS